MRAAGLDHAFAAGLVAVAGVARGSRRLPAGGPLLGQRRAALRDQLTALDETWIDDPANDDPRYARARARRALGGAPIVLAAPEHRSAALCPRDVAMGRAPAKLRRRPGRCIANRPVAEVRRLLGVRAPAPAPAARPGRPPPAAPRSPLPAHRHCRALHGHLGRRPDRGRRRRLLVCREAGEQARRSAGPRCCRWAKASSMAASWSRPTSRAAASASCAVTPRGCRAISARVSRPFPAARGALPVVLAEGETTCPLLSDTGAIVARPLGRARLLATLGDIRDEAALWRVAKSAEGA